MLCLLIGMSLVQSQKPDLAQSAGLDKKAVQHLLDRCKESSSLRLVVLKDGKPVIVEGFGNVLKSSNLMSATKSITALAVGFLIDEGKIPSVDSRVSEFFPQYIEGQKSQESIRNFLEHTSGIAQYDENEMQAITAQLFAGKETYRRVEQALAAPIESDPGSYFRYSNRGADFISGIVRQAAGEPMDDYLNRKLFTPLEIPKPYWMRDGAGDPHGSAELVMSADSMAKIGQLMLDKGKWQGKQLLSAKFIADATTPSSACPDDQPCGWLWWEIDPWFTLTDEGLRSLKKGGVSDEVIARLKVLKGRRWPSFVSMFLDMMHIVGDGQEASRFQGLFVKGSVTEQDVIGSLHRKLKPIGFYASGWGGQYILVLPKQRIVAVRTCGEGDWEADPSKYEMGDFYALVRALVK